MFNKIKIFILAALLPLTSCAGSLYVKLLQKPNLSPPRHGYINLTRKTIYEACLDRQKYIRFMETKFGLAAPDELKNDPDPQMCSKLEASKTASGVHIQKQTSKRTEKLASVILTANHFCAGDDISPTEVIEPEMMQFLDEFNITVTYEIRDYKGEEYKLTSNKPIASSKDSDACLLESEILPHKPIPISNKELKYGDRVMNVSTPYNRYMPPNIILNEGFYIGDHESGYIMISDMNIGPGASGSMVVIRRQNRWELVGMIFAVSIVYDNPVGVRTPYFEVGEAILALAASAKQIEELIKEKDAKG